MIISSLCCNKEAKVKKGVFKFKQQGEDFTSTVQFKKEIRLYGTVQVDRPTKLSFII
ncbi:3326_t:CDS:2 [Cetraspora pellucida]|uniref:3326_t:CDS:1 n=1 Tax=Cetraspora pellucida TaxID=1433469 RepID=A0A9N9B2Z1_9GLOM|nr:3326_t:CDS:2 [Cetraspora pellucida]